MNIDWEKELLTIRQSDSINEGLFEMIKIFHKFFPCDMIQLYNYSSFDYTIRGIYSYELPNLQSISHVHHSMVINEHVHRAIIQNEVRFFNDNKFQLSLGNQFILSDTIHNMLLVPLSINGVTVGYLTGVNVRFKVTSDKLMEMQSFSDSCLNALNLFSKVNTTQFTDKEIIVMEYISNGYTTKEISQFINISESTVKYFIKNVMLKTDSKNRTQAVTKLFRIKLLQ